LDRLGGAFRRSESIRLARHWQLAIVYPGSTRIAPAIIRRPDYFSVMSAIARFAHAQLRHRSSRATEVA
jgi:hypothetical protein